MYTLYRSIILERTRKCCKRFEVSFTALFRLQILAKFVNFWWENVQINLRFVGNNLSSKYGNTDNLWDEKMSTNNLSFKHRVFAIVIHFFLRKMSQLHKLVYYFWICYMFTIIELVRSCHWSSKRRVIFMVVCVCFFFSMYISSCMKSDASKRVSN
jgi:hypothetical protein